ncbi:MAG: energy transducer TonB [bacterium]
MHRYKTPEANLKRQYRKVFELSLIGSLIFILCLFHIFPDIKFRLKEIKSNIIDMQVKNVPQTRQVIPRKRTELPIPTESKDVSLDITIKPTELNQDIEEGYVFVPYDEPPELIGGYIAIKKQLKYPELALKSGIQGTVVVGILIDEKGNSIKTQILKDSGKNVGFEEAAQEALMAVKWKPAMQRDHYVKVWVSIPIHFVIQLIENSPNSTMKN